MFTIKSFGLKSAASLMLSVALVFGGFLMNASTALAAASVDTYSDSGCTSTTSTFTNGQTVYVGGTGFENAPPQVNWTLSGTGVSDANVQMASAGNFCFAMHLVVNGENGTYDIQVAQSQDDPLPAIIANDSYTVLPAVITNAATGITSSDATLNATNGFTDATGHSFWVSLNSFSTASPSIPVGVYSSPDLGAIFANVPFSVSLSSLTTSGVPGNMPPVTPSTTYHVVAWSLVSGTWYPGEEVTFTTSVVPSGDVLPPTLPTHLSPADNSTLTQAAMTEIDWSDSDDAESVPVTYVYQSANDPATNGNGSFVTPVYTSGALSQSKIATPGTPEGVYYWHVKAVDFAGNESAWTTPWKITVDNTPPPPVIEACNSGSFEMFTLGSVNGQDGWSGTGAYDHAIVDNTYGFADFGCKVLRISDAITSGSFGDWIFTKSLVNEAGETSAVNGGLSGGTRQQKFAAEFDIASVLPTLQSGMHISVSPDRGDGARMSYLRFEDQAAGIDVYFDDVINPGPLGTESNFNETKIATIDRNPHTIKFDMNLVDGPSNDVVSIYIDTALVHTGTSWEDYYRYDSEQTGGGNLVPTVDSLIIQARGTGHAENSGKGFLLDNFDLASSTDAPAPGPGPTVFGSFPGGHSGPRITTTGSVGGQVLGAEKFFFTLFLKKGPPYHLATWGNEVMELQKFLLAAGFNPGPIDGKFGPLTEAALIKFQLANGLVGDGIVGPLTRAALNK